MKVSRGAAGTSLRMSTAGISKRPSLVVGWVSLRNPPGPFNTHSRRVGSEDSTHTTIQAGWVPKTPPTLQSKQGGFRRLHPPYNPSRVGTEDSTHPTIQVGWVPKT